MQLVQTLSQAPVATQLLAQLRQFRQGGIRPTAAVEQSVDLIHKGTEGSQLGVATRHAAQGSTLTGTQMMADEQMPLVEQFGHMSLPGLGLPAVIVDLATPTPPG